MRATFWMTAVAALALWGMTDRARADEETIPVNELPKAVRKAVEKRFPKAEIEQASRETEDGKTIYEVTLEVEEDRDVDVSLSAEGKILEIEREVEFEDLPEPVRKTLAKKYPSAEIEKVEAISSDEGETYEVLLTTEVVLNAKGKITKVKDEKGEDDDDGEAKAKKGKHHEDGNDDDDDNNDDDMMMMMMATTIETDR